ncbi:MAG: FAD-binding protein [Alphaproteobacteria bacterium]|nr:FAD-binding protein [Alphaproteobacteria bacterium]MBV9372474.1 FAD-binding protein [Alphaproteobacteria bacterium]MBV9902149.1 FAD-binding protein [Alphaproteobacteria bacterium]
MVRIARGAPRAWENYHETVKQTVSQLQFIDLDPAEAAAARLAGTARLVGAELARGRDIRPVGGAWSFSQLHKTGGDVLTTRETAAVGRLDPATVVGGLDSRRLRLVSGGTIIKQLNVALEAERLSIRTSGASNGQSVAGAMATGTHGSAPSEGGFQEHVRGIHLVTAPGRSIWLEPAAPGGLDPAFARTFADEVVRSDALFQAAVVHLGGLGYVSGVLFEAVPRFLVGIVQRKAVLKRDALEELARGDFQAFAARFGFADPYFVQAILNPFRPDTRPALVRLLVPIPEEALFEELPFLGSLFNFDPLNALSDVIALLPPGARGEIIAILMRKLYPELPKDGGPPVGVTWGTTTPDHHKVGDLFSTGIAVERERLPEALDAMLPAFRQHDGGDAVCTLRFVRKSPGTLAATRWEHNVVIDFDGLRSKASRRAYERVLAAVDAAGIPSRQHWGKLSLLDAARVRRDHGDAAVDAWRAARAQLLSPAMASTFRSQALVDWGLA